MFCLWASALSGALGLLSSNDGAGVTACLLTASGQGLVHDGRGLRRVPQPAGLQLRRVCEETRADPAEADPEAHLCSEASD